MNSLTPINQNIANHTQDIRAVVANSVNNGNRFVDTAISALNGQQQAINTGFQRNSTVIEQGFTSTLGQMNQFLGHQVLNYNFNFEDPTQTERVISSMNNVATNLIIRPHSEIISNTIQRNNEEKNDAIMNYSALINQAFDGANSQQRMDQERINTIINAIQQLQQLKIQEVQNNFNNQQAERLAEHNQKLAVLRQRHANQVEVDALQHKYTTELKKAESYQKDKVRCLNDFHERLRNATDLLRGKNYSITRVDPQFDDVNQRIIERGQVNYRSW